MRKLTQSHSDILCPNPSENTGYTFVYLFLSHVTLVGFYIRPTTSTHLFYLTEKENRKIGELYTCSERFIYHQRSH